MRLLGYIRVSSEDQVNEGESLSVQDLQQHRYCELHGHELVDVIADKGVSAGVEFERRAGGAEVMDRLRDGEADGVVITSLDRLFRLTLDGLQTFKWFDREGLTVHAVGDKIDTTTPEGKLALTVRLATCEYERNKTAQRTRDTLRGMREQGMQYSRIAPYGCVAVSGKLYREPDTWGVREAIVEMRASGLSLRAICAEMKERGVPAPGGGVTWHVSSLVGILESHDNLKHIPLAPRESETQVSELRAVK